MNARPDEPEADIRLALLIRESVADRTLPAGFAARVAAAAAASARRRHRRCTALCALLLALGAAAGAAVALGRGEGAAATGRTVACRPPAAPESAVGATPLVGVVEATRRRRRRDRAAERAGESADND